jgi:hypothetical protein
MGMSVIRGVWICQSEDGCGLMIMFVGKFISGFFLLRRVVEFGMVCLVQRRCLWVNQEWFYLLWMDFSSENVSV